MWKHIAANAFSLLIVALIAFAGAIAWGQRQFVEPGPAAEAAYFEVARGASLAEVGDNLAAAGIISSPVIFRLGAHYTERADELRFGNYEIPAGASMQEVLEIITSGGQSTFRYTATYVIRGQGNGEMRLRERLIERGGQLSDSGCREGASRSTWRCSARMSRCPRITRRWSRAAHPSSTASWCPRG